MKRVRSLSKGSPEVEGRRKGLWVETKLLLWVMSSKTSPKRDMRAFSWVELHRLMIHPGK
jgi:hypothetical protein